MNKSIFFAVLCLSLAACQSEQKNASADNLQRVSSGTTSSAQSSNHTDIVETVQFAKGKSEAHLKRTLGAIGSITFDFVAKKGQRLNYSVNYGGTNSDIEVFLTEPNSQKEVSRSWANEPNELQLNTSGSHKVTINNTKNKAVPIDFGIVIENTNNMIKEATGTTTFSGQAERINISKQNPSIVWEQNVAAKSSKSFVFSAKKGQKLLLDFIDDTNIGSLDLEKYSVEPNGTLEMDIEVSKDYNFSVSNNSNKATSFRIAMSLE